MAKPTLSCCILTKNSAKYIEKLLAIIRPEVDELVIAIDNQTNDETESICTRYADKLFIIESPGHIERALRWLNEQCTSEWILRLDDDELPSKGLLNQLYYLLENREITHYIIPTRWVISENPIRWINQKPWFPDWHVRLFRNVSSLIKIPGDLHSGYEIFGPRKYISGGSLYHMNLVYNSEEEITKKIATYDALAPGKSMHHYYLPDKTTLALSGEPDGDRISAVQVMPAPSINRFTSIKRIDLSEIDKAGLKRFAVTENLFRASIEIHDTPLLCTSSQIHIVELNLTNKGDVTWPYPGLGEPQVCLSYHLYRFSGDLYLFEGHRTALPHSIKPGETTVVGMEVISPDEPGKYFIAFDLVIENVAWFSTYGNIFPRLEIDVVR